MFLFLLLLQYSKHIQMCLPSRAIPLKEKSQFAAYLQFLQGSTKAESERIGGLMETNHFVIFIECRSYLLI